MFRWALLLLAAVKAGEVPVHDKVVRVPSGAFFFFNCGSTLPIIMNLVC